MSKKRKPELTKQTSNGLELTKEGLEKRVNDFIDSNLGKKYLKYIEDKIRKIKKKSE